MRELFFSFGSESGTIFSKPLGLSITDERNKQAPHRSQVIELFRELRLPLYGYLISVGIQPHEAEDVIQETFLRLHQQLAQDVKINDPRPWAFRVAHNLSMNLHRSSRRFVSELESDSAHEQRVPMDSPDHRPTPEDSYLQKELLQRLDAGMARLTEQQSQCLQLRVEGLKYREIANVMGIGVSSVAELIQRAIIRLTGELNG
jgi:RNA polymerase sigma-70 factor (ECF subfamily)